MGSTDLDAVPNNSTLELKLFGLAELLRGGVAQRLPPSRKVRALLAYLALSPHPVARERLCSLFWDVPNDPRGELRWCLSKLRALLDSPDRKRVRAEEDRVSLDLEGCAVDAIRIMQAAGSGFDRLSNGDLQDIVAACEEEFLEGVEVERSAEFGHWLAGRRNEFRSHHVMALAELVGRMPVGTPEGIAGARRWLEHAPLDVRAHGRLLAELARRGLLDDCARHMETAGRMFASEGVDFSPVRDAWARIRGQIATVSAMPVVPLEAARDPAATPASPTRRASVAVMPFRGLYSGRLGQSTLGDALTHDIISRLARLRNLFVIARGSVFAIADENLGLPEIGRRLGVDYVATGFLQEGKSGVTVAAEIAEVATEHIVWTDRFEVASADRLAVIEEISNGIVSSIAAEIETAERNRAMLKHPDSLDAWEAYHRGLWHMYRFTREENAKAAEFFRFSARLDPTFSRAYAGLSFTHWQSAFQNWGDRAEQTRLALEAAGQSVLVDDQNPAAHWSMGRALWMAGEAHEALRELEQSVHLSPNFALGHYALSFVHCQSGDPTTAISSSDHSRLLSPCDPLLFGMLGARAMALVRLGAYDEAAEWGLRAVSRPNAHVHILAIAAHCLALAGRIDEARAQAARIRLQNPAYGPQDFLGAFRFAPDAVERFREGAALIGFTV